jgi:hypothetical protein
LRAAAIFRCRPGIEGKDIQLNGSTSVNWFPLPPDPPSTYRKWSNP